jgi:hypothetical protein
MTALDAFVFWSGTIEVLCALIIAIGARWWVLREERS